MSLKVALLSLEDPEWDIYLSSLENIYIHKGFLTLSSESSEGVVPRVFFASKNDQYFALSIMVKKIPQCEHYDFETPYGYSGPISNSSCSIFLEECWKEFSKICRQENIIAGFFRLDPIVKNVDIVKFNPQIKTWDNGPIVLLDLKESLDEIWKNLSSNVRTNIRKANKRGYSLCLKSEEDLHELYEIYVESMDHKNAGDFYFFTNDFFKKMEGTLGNQFSAVMIKDSEGRLVSGGSLLMNGETGIIHLSATRREALKDGCAYLLRYELISLAKRLGLKFLNMGGGLGREVSDSLFKFKSQFSSWVSIHTVGSYVINHEAYDSLCSEWEKNNREKGNVNYFLRYRL